MHGLNTYDYGARQYYAALPVWDRVDPLAEKQNNFTKEMKRFMFFLILVANYHVMFSQENMMAFFTNATKDSVAVYSDAVSEECFVKVKEDEQKEVYFDVEILEKSEKRYKVKIYSFNDNNAEPILGWVDKEQCGVWLHGRYIKDNFWVVQLYEKPGYAEPIIRLTDTFLDEFGKYSNNSPVFVLDYIVYKGKYWIKTAVTKNKKRFVGWTRDYCPIKYYSCN
jgi:hypothetical protein